MYQSRSKEDASMHKEKGRCFTHSQNPWKPMKQPQRIEQKPKHKFCFMISLEDNVKDKFCCARDDWNLGSLSHWDDCQACLSRIKAGVLRWFPSPARVPFITHPLLPDNTHTYTHTWSCVFSVSPASVAHTTQASSLLPEVSDDLGHQVPFYRPASSQFLSF